MAGYVVNKGVGKSVEVKGLRAQYFIYAIVGVVLSFVLFLLLSFIVGQIAAVAVAALSLICTLSVSFYLNNKYGEKGLGKVYARMLTPDRISSDKRLYKILVKDGNQVERY